MKVVVNQPNYIPWRGYFDLIDDADLFFLHDDVQYTKQDWRNRNKIKTSSGLVWLTVPVEKTSSSTLIRDVKVSLSADWAREHRRLIENAYRRAAFYQDYAEAFFDILFRRHVFLTDLNEETTRFFMQALDIHTPIKRVSELGLEGHKTEKLIRILQSCGATAYLSGPAAQAYIEPESFKEAKIDLLWKVYDYAPYPQLGGAFDPQVSILDLLFNCGTQAKMFLKSLHAPEGGGD